MDRLNGQQFWTHPLVLWFCDCVTSSSALISEKDWRSQDRLGSGLLYSDLCNAVVVHLLFLYIDPRETNQKAVITIPDDVGGRLRNLATVLANIQTFYKHAHRQLIVMPLPDLLTISRNPHEEGGGEEMQKVLLLLLGCAVQSERKQQFIDRIKAMEVELQTAIVKEIQKVTNQGECVLTIGAADLNDEKCTAKVLTQLERVVQERDSFALSMFELVQEQESDSSSATSVCCNGDVCTRKLPEALQHDGRTPSPMINADRHANVELASMKAELRKIRNEMEEKLDTIAELREDLEQKEEQVIRLGNEKFDLLKEARAAKDYRDEIDCLQHKLMKMDRLEVESGKLREKLSEMEFFRSRVEELRAENDILLETRSMLEDRIESWKSKVGMQVETETKWLEAQKMHQLLQTELNKERDKLIVLLDDNDRLKKECIEYKEKCSFLEKQLDSSLHDPDTPRADGGNLGKQLADSDRSTILALQLSNVQLRSRIDQQSLSMTQETDILRLKVNDSQLNACDLADKNESLSEIVSKLEEEKQTLHQNLQEARRNFTEFQMDKENHFRREGDMKLEDLQQKLTIAKEKSEKIQSEWKLAEEKMNVEAEDAKNKLEKRISSMEKERKALENDKMIMKTAFEQKIDKLEKKLTGIKEIEEKLIKSENKEHEISERLFFADSECKSLLQKLNLKTTNNDILKEDLILEKTQNCHLKNLLNSLWNLLNPTEEMPETEGEICEKMTEICVENSKENRLKIEIERCRIEVEELKREIDRLSQSKCRSNVNDSDIVKELNEENQNVKQQVGILQEKLKLAQEESSGKTAKLCAVRHDLDRIRATNVQAMGKLSQTRLQSMVASLQVSLRNSELQEDLLRKDNEELRKQLLINDREQQTLRMTSKKMQTLHGNLLGDHDRLQTLHDQLIGDYDKIKQHDHQLKTRLKDDIKTKNKEVKLTRECLHKERRTTEEIKALLSQEREQKQREFKAFAVLQNDYSQMTRANQYLRNENQDLKAHCELMENDLKQAQKDDKLRRMQIIHLNNQINQLNESVRNDDLQVAKFVHKIEMLSQLNTSMEEENRSLLKQLDAILVQNQQLLTRAMNDKDQFHADEKELQEQMHTIRKQNDKLEEKILEHNRMMGNRKLDKEKPTFVKRAAKALIHRNCSRKSIRSNSVENALNCRREENTFPSEFCRGRPGEIISNYAIEEKSLASSGQTVERRRHSLETKASSSDEFESIPTPDHHYACIQRVENEALTTSRYGSMRSTSLKSESSFPSSIPNDDRFDFNGPDRCNPRGLPPLPRPPWQHLQRGTTQRMSLPACRRSQPTAPRCNRRPPPPPYYGGSSNGQQRPQLPPLYPQPVRSPSPTPRSFAPSQTSTPDPVTRRAPPFLPVDTVVCSSMSSVRDPSEERLTKTASLYENVVVLDRLEENDEEARGIRVQNGDNGIWYEYGCV